MKPSSRVIVAKSLLSSFFLGFLVLTPLTHAASVGELQLAGEGCQNTTGKVRLIVPSQSLYSVPLNLHVIKSEDVMIARKACTMLLPIVLDSNEKLVVEDASQKINVRLNAETTAKAQLEVFLAGTHGEIIKAETQAHGDSVKESLKLNQRGLVVESGCGEQVIVRANESIAIIGTGSARAISDNLRLKLK